MTTFSGNPDGDPWLLGQLMRCPDLTGLKSLDVSSTRFTNDMLVEFVSLLPQAAFASTLEVLDFSSCFHINDAGGNTLATARSLQGIQRLILKDVPIRPAARSMLKKTFGSRVVF